MLHIVSLNYFNITCCQACCFMIVYNMLVHVDRLVKCKYCAPCWVVYCAPWSRWHLCVSPQCIVWIINDYVKLQCFPDYYSSNKRLNNWRHKEMDSVLSWCMWKCKKLVSHVFLAEVMAAISENPIANTPHFMPSCAYICNLVVV